MWSLRVLVESCKSCQTQIKEKWVPARPDNYKYRTLYTRIREAWLVFTGEADCFFWPKDQ